MKPSIFAHSIEEAKSLSQKLLLDAIVIVYSESCYYCNLLKTDLANNPHVTANKIICYIDYNDSQDIVDQFEIKSVPFSFLLNSDNHFIGYNKTKYFSWIKNL